MGHPRVAYDISVLGISHFNQRSRTGIFRVIDENVKHLTQRNDVELTLTACRSYWEMAASLQYVKQSYPEALDKFTLPIHSKGYSSLLYKTEKKLVDFKLGSCQQS
ncbi:MAG: hypothetical protein HC780_11890 [Leptolyngbyaceae cyanobacterium CSU_1_3]|nr:hypothetical protein [Leptolyngbyaceae cyanobacterium CSU_1_3]